MMAEKVYTLLVGEKKSLQNLAVCKPPYPPRR
jgi:hypothetical protein